MAQPQRITEIERYVPSRQQRSPLQPRTLWYLFRMAFSKWNEDPTLRFGAGLAYYTSFAVVPLMFIVVEIATVLLGEGAAEGLLLEQIESLIGEQVRKPLDSSFTAGKKTAPDGSQR